MKITRVEYWQEDMQLSEPYLIAYETIEQASNIFLRIETNRGITGYGCAAPDWEIVRENPQTVLHACECVVAPILKGSDSSRLERVLAELLDQLHHQPSVMAMVDMAFYDILGKAADLPAYKLLGGYREAIATSVTIGIMPVDRTVAKATMLVGKGIKCLKIKGGLDVDADIERVLRVQEAVGANTRLRFDANQGYTVEETVRFAKATSRARLEVIEQPTPRHRQDLLIDVAGKVSVPIMADESMMGVQDVLSLAKQNFAGMINVKLMKVGGISEARRVNAVASAVGLAVMVGCMDESALGIAAGLHLALSSPEVGYADLDSHLDLVADPAAGAVRLYNGLLMPTGKLGLGFDF